MEQLDEKYKGVMNKLQTAKPQLSQPEDLTESIMTSINERKTNKVGKALVMIRPWISIAAVFLIGLYIFQQNDAPVMESHNVYVQKSHSEMKTDNCLASFIVNKDYGERFLNSYFCYVKQTELKNKSSEQLILKLKQKL